MAETSSKPTQQTIIEPFARVVEQRRSVRGFLPDLVPQETLEAVFELAQRSPSNCNTQPWTVHVVSGDLCQQMKQKITESMLEGRFSMDFPYDGVYDGVYKDRQYDAAKQLYSAMGIERSDKAGRHEAFMRNFDFFGAPHAAFLFMPEGFDVREAADLGMYSQTLMLSLTAYGLASCPQTALGFHADVVRELLDIPAEQKLLFGISFGYEDTSESANTARVGRAPLTETTVFHR